MSIINFDGTASGSEAPEEMLDPFQSSRRKKIDGLLNPLDVQDLGAIDPSWRQGAACKDNEEFTTEDFFHVSVTSKNINRILALQELCKKCPVAAECLHEALMFNYDGYWAGFTAKQRVAYIRSMRNNSVVDLTIDECQTILHDLRNITPVPVTAVTRRARLAQASSM